MKKVIRYTPGSHGNFMRFLFDCYDNQIVRQYKSNKAGNWHLEKSDITNNLCFDMANAHNIKKYNALKDKHQRFNIVFDTLEEFFYLISCYVDRGGKLIDKSGIDLLEKDIHAYQEEYKADVDYVQRFKDLYNVETRIVPRSVLRNYFTLTFMTYFNHICWQVNNDLKKDGSILIKLKDILDYPKLKKQLDEIFEQNLDFQELHKNLLYNNNRPFEQMSIVNEIIKAVETGNDIPIKGLNTISEAYVCFYFEKKHYDINFNLGEKFFGSTGELINHIRYFPSYMKKPNNLFLQHWRIYNDKH